MHISTLERDRLKASLACCDLYVEQGTTQITVPELAAAGGISVRTFHRYFPTKSETVLPMFGELSRLLNDFMDQTQVTADLQDLLLEGYRQMYCYTRSHRTLNLMPLIVHDQEMWAVLLRAFHVGETAFVAHLAPHLTVPTDHPRARAVAAAFASSNRIAFQALADTGADHEAVFAEQLDAFALH